MASVFWQEPASDSDGHDSSGDDLDNVIKPNTKINPDPTKETNSLDTESKDAKRAPEIAVSLASPSPSDVRLPTSHLERIQPSLNDLEKTGNTTNVHVEHEPQGGLLGPRAILETGTKSDTFFELSQKARTVPERAASDRQESEADQVKPKFHLDGHSAQKVKLALHDAREHVAAQTQTLLSTNAENFRHKLILNFHLIDILNQPTGQTQIPQYELEDVQNKAKQFAMLKKDPNDLVKLPQAKGGTGTSKAVDQHYRRLQHKASKYPALDFWAKWVVRSGLFQSFILALILLNSVVLGIQAEVGDSLDPSLEPLKLCLDIFDYCSLFVFTLEILLKWMESFFPFWRSSWNVFDFFVTFASLIPEVINVATGSFGKRLLDKSDSTYNIQVVASNLRIFRVLRALKVVTRFGKVKIIILAITKAVGSMLSILVLTFAFAYIYSVVGVVYFRDGYIAKSDELVFPNSFTSITNALITLFQLLSLDKWRTVLDDSQVTANGMVAGFYVFSWVIFGSFVVKNLFIGILVENFQSIRGELKDEATKDSKKKQTLADLNQFVADMDKADKEREQQDKERAVMKDKIKEKGAGSVGESESIRSKSLEEIQSLQSLILQHKTHEEEDWIYKAEKIMDLLENQKTPHIWPKDTVFQYFISMEALLENLEERKELLNMADDILLLFHDDP